MEDDDILAPFLKPVRDITQNFDINLVELLEDYLIKIGISDTEAEEVLNSKNFAEAAIMLQQSVNIYGRKVDYLWQLLMQVLQHNKLVGQKIAAEKKDRKKQPDQYFSPEFCEIDDETLFSGDVNINISYEPFSDIKFLPKYNPQLEARGSDERNLILYGPQTNVIGKKYDFRLNRYLSSGGLLVDEPVLHKEVCVCHEHVSCSKMKETVHDEGMIFEDESVKSFQECCLHDNVSIYSKCSKEGSYTEEAAMSHRQSDKIVNICEDAWKPWPFDKVVPNKKFVKKVTYKVPPELVNITDEETKRKVFDVNMEKRENCSSFLSFMTTIGRRTNKGNDYFNDSEYMHGLKKSQPVKDAPSLPKLQAEFDEMGKKLAEEFNDMHYSSDDDQTGGEEEDNVNEDDKCSMDENFDVKEEDNLEILEMYINDIQFPKLEDQLGEELQREMMIPPILEIDLAYEQYALETCFIKLEPEGLQGISSKVREWHDKLSPRLKAASERGHFDINAYGAKIINSFTDVGVGSRQSTLSFGDIVKDEPTKDVPRFFLAALMLANSYNVEISKSDESQLEIDSVNLTLLNPVLNKEYGDADVLRITV